MCMNTFNPPNIPIIEELLSELTDDKNKENRRQGIPQDYWRGQDLNPDQTLSETALVQSVRVIQQTATPLGRRENLPYKVTM